MRREEFLELIKEIDSGKYDEVIARCLEDVNKM